ncbi:hypothetical protein [Chryseobacterium lactis]|nr:hypothetical protein [Chryseobacterium lactis]
MEKNYLQLIKNKTKAVSPPISGWKKSSVFLLLMMMGMFLSQELYGQCTAVVNPRGGSQTFNGVTVTRAYKDGLVIEDNSMPIAFSYCDAPNSGTDRWLQFGQTGPNNMFGTSSGYYTYTFQFSKPVNDIVFNISALHANEWHTVSTNAGTVSLLAECNNNETIINGNSITSNRPYYGWGEASMARIKITSTMPYTQLTFSGNGETLRNGAINLITYQGSVFNLCSGSIVPAVAPTISGITPSTQTRCFNTPAQAITVNATGATSYQWWVNTINSQTGATAIPGATSASYTPPNNSPVGTLYYYVVATNSTGSTTSPIANVVTQNCITSCYKPGATATAGKPALITKIGISSLTRTGAQNADNWPAIRKGGWLALEARTKGFVPNRVAFNGSGNPVGIAAANFIEGMLVYDTTNKCLKMYTSKDGSATLGWYCITTQTCPD